MRNKAALLLLAALLVVAALLATPHSHLLPHSARWEFTLDRLQSPLRDLGAGIGRLLEGPARSLGSPGG